MTPLKGVDGQYVTSRIGILMAQKRLRSITDLHRLTGLNRSSLSLKFSGARSWSIDDLQVIAAELGTTVAYLIGETDDPQSGVQPGDTELVIPLSELLRRTAFLGIDGRKVIYQTTKHAEDLKTGNVCVNRRFLEALAVEHQFPIEYLTDYERDVDWLEALIELGRAAKRAGIRHGAVRPLTSLSNLTVDELRTLTRSLDGTGRSHDGTGQSLDGTGL